MKSNVSDLMDYMHCVYRDACMKCVADVSDPRDLGTLRSRIEKEGISFLTITLPAFCADFERSLDRGFIDSKSFRNFRKLRAIPAFLQGMLSQLFDVETGRLFYEEQHTNVASDFSVLVESVRQICLTFKKVEIPCTLARVDAAITNFINVERSFGEFSLRPEDRRVFSDVSSVLWHNLVSTIALSDCVPRHGPGATAERVVGNHKFEWQEWHDRLEPYFPVVGNGYPLGIQPDSQELKKLTIVSEAEERPVRVVTVPKTLKSPRIIAIEPCCQQFVQQGIRGVLYDAIESYWLTRGHINFRDQTVNQKLAIISSNSGRLATIDLSDASDRVPLDLALEMFLSNPDLRDAIEACRSTSAELPSGAVIGPLRKFASMGSALCFPIEAMYFYTVCVVALLSEHDLPATPANVFSVTRELYVYGDDILCPSTNATLVLNYLQKYNCKVNDAKTFFTGKFRESCGVDAYDGEMVNPIYLRQMAPENRRQASNIISWCQTANLFYKKGYWRTTTFMFEKLEALVGPLPYVDEKSAGLGRISFLGYRSAERWNDSLQRFEVKTLVPRPVFRTGKLEGYAALGKSLSRLEGSLELEPALEITLSSSGCLLFRRNAHLEQFALHGAVALQRRWVPTHVLGYSD